MTIPSPARGIGIYLRKSSDKQGDLSLPAQERIIRERIVNSEGVPVYRVYRDVLSGRRADRADYQQLLADAVRESCRPSRSTRSTASGAMQLRV